MTIRMLKPWNGYQPDQIVSFTAPEEARLVGLGLASTDLDGDAEGLSLVKAAVNATGEITFSTGGETVFTVLHGEIMQSGRAPTVMPRDYLHNVKVLAVSPDKTKLFAVNAATPRQISIIDAETKAETLVSMATLPNAFAADGVTGVTSYISTIVVESATTLWVVVAASTANAVMHKVVSTDGWASATSTPSLYIGADDPNTGIGGNARGMVGYTLLSQYNFAIDSNGDRYLGEYMAATEANGQRIRLFKMGAAASAWTTIWSLNVGASDKQARHIHCVQINPIDNTLWISTGDKDAWNDGNSSGAADHCWTIRWDKTTQLPDATTYTTPATMTAALAATPGVQILHGQQRHRVVQFMFRSDAVYYQSDADPSQVTSFQECGIWRVDHGCTTLHRVFAHPSEEQAISGYYCAEIDGHMVFTPAGNDNATFATDSVPVITSSTDGQDFAIAGRIGKTIDSTALPYGCVVDINKQVYVAYSSLAGKGTPGGYQTIVFTVESGTPHNAIAYDKSLIVRDPEVLHPVYWVDAANSTGAASDAAAPAGYSPRTPWLTLAYGLQSSRMTHGGRLKVMGAALAVSAAINNCNWSANANPGGSALPLEIDFRGCNVLFAVNNYMLKWTATQHLKIMGDYIRYNGNAGLGAVAAGSASLVDTTGVSADSNCTYYECLVGYLGRELGVSGGRLGYIGRGTQKIVRSRVMMGNAAEIFQNVVGTAATTIKVEDSAIDECSRLMTDVRSDTVYDVRNSLFYGRERLIKYNGVGAASTGKTQFKNSAVLTGASASPYLFSAGTNKPTAFAGDPFLNCVLNTAYDGVSIDSITITAQDWWQTNTPSALPQSYIATIYKPADPASGNWRDTRYPTVGPRVALLGDKWAAGAI